MNKQELEAVVKEAAKSLKIEKDLSDFSRMLKKTTVEVALNAERNNHLGYEKHHISKQSNSRNEYIGKTVRTDDGTADIDVPRDRDNPFEPQLVKKQQTQLIGKRNSLTSFLTLRCILCINCSHTRKNIYRFSVPLQSL